MRGPGSILTEGNIMSLDFFLFSRSEASDANIAIVANVVCLWKPGFEYFTEEKTSQKVKVFSMNEFLFLHFYD